MARSDPSGGEGCPSGRRCVLFAVILLAGCHTTSLEEDRARLEKEVAEDYGIWVDGVRLRPTPGSGSAWSVPDRWPEIREAQNQEPAELRIAVQRMVSEVDRLRQVLETPALALPAGDALRWREASEQMRQARARLDAQLGNYELAPPDRREEIKREIEAAWRDTQRSFDVLRSTVTPP